MLVIFIKIPFYTETQLEPESVLAEEEPMGTVPSLGCVCVCVLGFHTMKTVETESQHAFKCHSSQCVISFLFIYAFYQTAVMKRSSAHLLSLEINMHLDLISS